MKLRKVKFKKFIPVLYEDIEGQYSKSIVEGTGMLEKDFIHNGFFHKWGQTYEEFEANAGNYSIGIIEDMQGEIQEVTPSWIKFIDQSLFKFTQLK